MMDLQSRNAKSNATSSLEDEIEKTNSQINEIIYSLYDLDENEISIVEASIES